MTDLNAARESELPVQEETRRGFFRRFGLWFMGLGLLSGYGAFAVLIGRFLLPSEQIRRAWQFVTTLAETGIGQLLTYTSPAGNKVVVARVAGQDAVIHPPSDDHFTTAQLADTNRLDIDTVRIKVRHRFEPQAPGQELSVLLETGDGEPLVVENYLGRGRIIFQALPFDVGWSNLPITKSFVVMVQDWLDYLTRPAATQFNRPAGGRIEWTPPPSTAAGTVTIKLPNGAEKPLAGREAGDAAVYRYSQTHVPGRYEVCFGDVANESNSIPFQVARDVKESDLKLLTDEQQETLTKSAGIHFSQQFINITLAATGGHRDKPIWNTLLAALFVLLVVELLLATWAARRRAPSP